MELGQVRLTSQYGCDDSGQDTPGIDGHVEDGKELPPLFRLRERGKCVSRYQQLGTNYFLLEILFPNNDFNI